MNYHPLRTIPSGIFSILYWLQDPRSASSLSTTDKRARAIFLSESMQKALIYIHFRQMPSPDMSALDHYLRLKIAQFRKMEPIQLSEVACSGNFAVEVTGSSDWTKALSKALSNHGSVAVLWDLTTQKPMHTFTKPPSIQSMQLCPTGKKALIKSENAIEVWDLETFSLLQELPDTSPAGQMMISKNGKKALSISNPPTLWDLETGTPIHRLTTDLAALDFVPPQMSVDGTKALIAYNGRILKLWDLNQGTCLLTLTTNCEPIQPFIMNDTATIAVTLHSSELVVWDLISGTLIAKYTNSANDNRDYIPQEVVIHPHEKTIFSVNLFSLTILDLRKRECHGFKFAGQGLSKCMKISDDGTRLWIGSGHLKFITLDIAPLPHTVIQHREKQSKKNPASATIAFNSLPHFVQQLDPDCLRGRQQSSNETNLQRVHETLIQYSRCQLIPGIIELLKLSESAREKSYFIKTADGRFDLLPEEVQNLVYWSLTRLHKKNLELPENLQFEYGNNAFHQKNGCFATTQEKIAALEDAMNSASIARSAKKPKSLT